jgi:hypothetical protein
MSIATAAQQKKKIVYKCSMTLLHVLAHNGHLQGGGYQRKKWLSKVVIKGKSNDG